VRSKLSFNSEPALWIGLLGSVFSLALAFGLRLTVDQQGAIIAVTIGVLALATRQSVVPAYRRDPVAVPVVPAAPVVVPAPVFCATRLRFRGATGGRKRAVGQPPCHWPGGSSPLRRGGGAANWRTTVETNGRGAIVDSSTGTAHPTTQSRPQPPD